MMNNVTKLSILNFNPFGKVIAVSLLIFAMIAASCASYVKVHPEPINIQSVVEPGDKVKIVTKDNREIELVVVDVNDVAIKGKNETVFFVDISKLEEMTSSAGENTLVIIGITTAAALTGVLMAPAFIQPPTLE